MKNNADITIVEAANLYITRQKQPQKIYFAPALRDEGFRYRDIVIICNDQTTRASIISRVFDEYGLEIFRDAKRKISIPMWPYTLSLCWRLWATGTGLRIFSRL